ncbi:hypothetical protein [Streptococcus parauberis]|uniref:hypothetical protein n=1 Tax=Streptococcus parauberis TaxID=1348 RepID=UPI000C5A3B9F|nr:hypothetical protein [Streptococcus parauberis]PIA83683.1 hypothetical protein ADO07_01551 [Streptococcus parauberis]
MTLEDYVEELKRTVRKIVDVLMKNKKTLIRDFVIIAVIGLLIVTLSYYCGYKEAEKQYQPQINGLTKQLDRTQYQLKKVSEESADKTARIAELTNNGG